MAAGEREANPRNELILYGFVPDFKRLTLITGDKLKQRYSGVTIKGIYSITPHGDQRYVETMSADGRADYAEIGFAAQGRWYVDGDQLCFRYDDSPQTAHCSYRFDYGDCMISYSHIMGSRPMNPARWRSVKKIAPAMFSRKDLTRLTEQDFTCRALIG